MELKPFIELAYNLIGDSPEGKFHRFEAFASSLIESTIDRFPWRWGTDIIYSPNEIKVKDDRNYSFVYQLSNKAISVKRINYDQSVKDDNALVLGQNHLLKTNRSRSPADLERYLFSDDSNNDYYFDRKTSILYSNSEVKNVIFSREVDFNEMPSDVRLCICYELASTIYMATRSDEKNLSYMLDRKAKTYFVKALQKEKREVQFERDNVLRSWLISAISFLSIAQSYRYD